MSARKKKMAPGLVMLILLIIRGVVIKLRYMFDIILPTKHRSQRNSQDKFNDLISFFTSRINAVAERINGILKYEFGLVKTIPNLRTAKLMIAEVVHLYNNKRRHRSPSMSTPANAHHLNNHSYQLYGELKQTA
jgi:hypothetical protein